jgi:hypothetical protein
MHTRDRGKTRTKEGKREDKGDEKGGGQKKMHWKGAGKTPRRRKKEDCRRAPGDIYSYR